MIRKRKTYNQIILVMGIVIALLIAALIFALSTRGAGAGNTPAELTVYDDPNDALPPVRFNAGMVEYEAEGGAWLPLASLEALFAALPEPTPELTPTTAPAPTETPAASGTPAPSDPAAGGDAEAHGKTEGNSETNSQTHCKAND